MSTFVIEDYADLDDYLNNHSDSDYRVYEQYEFDVPYYLDDNSKPEFKGASFDLPAFIETLREEKKYEEGKGNSGSTDSARTTKIHKSDIDKVTSEYNENVKLFWKEYGKNISAPKCVYEEQYYFDVYDNTSVNDDSTNDNDKWKGPIITEILDDDETTADNSNAQKVEPEVKKTKEKNEPQTEITKLEMSNIKTFDLNYYDEPTVSRKIVKPVFNERSSSPRLSKYEIAKNAIPVTSHIPLNQRYVNKDLRGPSKTTKLQRNMRIQADYGNSGKVLTTNIKPSLTNNNDLNNVFAGPKFNFFETPHRRIDPYDGINIKLNAYDYFTDNPLDNLIRKNGFVHGVPRIQTNIPFLFETNKSFSVYPTAPPVIQKKPYNQKHGHTKVRNHPVTPKRSTNRSFEDSWLLPYEVVDAYGEDVIKLINNHNRLIDNFPDTSRQFTAESYDHSLKEVDIYDLPAGSIFAEASQPIPEINIYGRSDSRLPTFNSSSLSGRKNVFLNPTQRINGNYPVHTHFNQSNNAYKTAHRQLNESHALYPKHNFDKVNVTVSAKSRLPTSSNTRDDTTCVLEKLNDIYHYVITTTPSENIKCKIEEVHGSLLSAENTDGFKEMVTMEEVKKVNSITREENKRISPTVVARELTTPIKGEAKKPGGLLNTLKGELKKIHQAVGKKEQPKKYKESKYVDF